MGSEVALVYPTARVSSATSHSSVTSSLGKAVSALVLFSQSSPTVFCLFNTNATKSATKQLSFVVRECTKACAIQSLGLYAVQSVV